MDITNNKKLTILSERRLKKKHHVSYDTTLGMEDAFAAEGADIKNFSCKILYLANKVFRRLNIDTAIPEYSVVNKCKGQNILFIAMGYVDVFYHRKALKKAAKKGKVGIYCFDVWESEYYIWEKCFNYIDPDFIFFAYKEACEAFGKKGKWSTYFVPQSMDERFFHERNIDKSRLFMQMGRKNMSVHNMILNYLSSHGIEDTDNNYLYSRAKDKLVCPDTNDLAENICRSYFFVCAPQSMENSKLTGKVSDVTARFYEAMACKTLIIGYKPDTYDDLFPSDSMIELDPDGSDFEEKVNLYLNDQKLYNETVERNYRLLMENHKWKNRYEAIISVYNNQEDK